MSPPNRQLPTARRRIFLGGCFVVVCSLGLFVTWQKRREVALSPTPAANIIPGDQSSNVAVQRDHTQAWEETWLRYLAQPPSPERDALLARQLKKLSVVNEEAATGRLLELHPTDRVSIVTATLRTAAQKSADDAVLEAIRFCDEDPSYSLEYGRALIATLANKGEYQTALHFVLAEEDEGWLEENGSKWLTTLFSTWAKAAPDQARQTAETMIPPNFRDEVLQTIAGAQAEPHASL